MADIMNGRYALADPSSGLTVLSLEGGELNMFGSCTRIRTTQREFYPQIQDEPTELKVENHIAAQLITGLVVAAALAAVAVAVVVTGGAALAPLACALGGAAIGAGAVAIGTAISDSETGYNRSWGGLLAKADNRQQHRVYGRRIGIRADSGRACCGISGRCTGEHDVGDFHLYGGYSTRNRDSRRLWTGRGRGGLYGKRYLFEQQGL